VISFDQLQAHRGLPNATSIQYRCQANVDLYDSPTLQTLATQAAAGRYLRVMAIPDDRAIEPPALSVRLCEDDYPGWLALADLALLTVAEIPYTAVVLSASDITHRLPDAIAFARTAMAQPNQYLWGGTVGPNYDCSGLIQTAFASVGIWLPRDAYQQEAFTQAIAPTAVWMPGDLVFFGSPTKATHVGLYLGDGCYIHSSGKDQGRNGIGIDRLSAEGDTVSQAYYAQLRGVGRIIRTYQPQFSS